MINIEEFTFLSSDGQTRLHAMLWLPEGEIRGILQIAHGVAEHVARYDGFARYLCARGIAVAGHDHLGHGKSLPDGATPVYFGAQDGWQSKGLGTAAASGRMGWGLLGRCALLVLCMLAYLYVLLFLCEKAFLLDFRFIWPFFKTFDAARFGQFCVYLPVFALFFILNNSKIMASARCKATYQPGFKGFLGCWWRNALMMVGGILIIVLIEYIPFFMNIAPGADLLFGSTFGGPFMSLLILFVPQVLVFSVLCTYTYRRTGSVYVGALTAASLACWIVTGGSSML